MWRSNGTVALRLASLAILLVPACADDRTSTHDPIETEVGAAASQSGPDRAPREACGQIDEFPVPTTSDGIFPNDIVVGADGNLWFATFRPFLGRVSPDGEVTLIPIPASVSASPLRLAAGPDGNIWFGTAGGVAAFSPRHHTVREIPVPGFGDVSTTVADLVAGPDGAIWVLATTIIARVTPQGHTTTFAIPVESLNGSRIARGADGNIWFTGGGIAGLQAVNRITRHGVITRFPITSPGLVFGLAPGIDGALWFTENGGGPGQNSIGRMTTDGVASTVVQLPDSASPPSEPPSDMPLEITAGPDGRMYFTTYLVEPKNYIGRVNRHGGLTKLEVPTPNAASFGITAGPDGNVWFTENFNGLVGRVNVAACHRREHGGHDHD